MKILEQNRNFQLKNSGVIIGKFEGMHLGHQALLKELSHLDVLNKVMFTFDRHPSSVLGNQKDTILTKEERREFVRPMIDVLVEYPFDETIRQMSSIDFIEHVLVKQLDAKKIIVGDDFSFGYHRQGNVHLLKEVQEKYGYETIIIPKVLYQDIPISSTRIKENFNNGCVKDANAMLGYDFFATGIVVQGNQIGRTLGVPTANIIPENTKFLPPNGVYVSRITFNRKVYYGITNIGTKPTIGENNPKNIETHIFDFDKDIYGTEIKIELLDFLRPEIMYHSVTELKIQLMKDVQTGMQWHRKIILDK